jgi:3-hydroxyacyl-CoA dehydrogenase
MLTGRRLAAGDALAARLIDIIADSPLEHARQWARALVAEGAPLPRARSGQALADQESARAEVANAVGTIPPADIHAFARARIVRCVLAAIEAPFEQGAEVEAEAFLECLASPEREQLVAQFFAARAARKTQNT